MEERRNTPPSVIAIRSSTSSVGSSDSRPRQPKKSSDQQDNNKTGLHLALAGVERVAPPPPPEAPRSVGNASIGRLSQRSRFSNKPTLSRMGSLASGVTFALEEGVEEDHSEEEELEQPPPQQQEEGGEDLETSRCDLCMPSEHEEEDEDVNNNIKEDSPDQEDNKSTSSTSVQHMSMPDIDIDEEDDDETTEEEEEAASSSERDQSTRHFDLSIMQDLGDALQKYASPTAAGSGSSSDYWKGLLVGIFLCQAVFVPLWAAWSVSSEGSGGFFGFFSLMIRRFMVGTAAGLGFVIMAVVAMEYDKALHREIDALKKKTMILSEEINNARIIGASTEVRQPQRQRLRPSRTQSRASSVQPASDMFIVEEEQNHPIRSISVTAPSTSSEAGASEADDHKAREEKVASSEKDPPVDEEIKEEFPKPHIMSVVNHTPDTLKEGNNMSFNSGGLVDLSDASLMTPVATTLPPEEEEEAPLDDEPEKPQQEQSTPDFYPDATVLLAHVSGFSAWSSQRSPEEVFTLLHKLHQRFDAAAKRLDITKVEATSEQYMAVSGVPEAQEDAAIRMVKFAKTILQSMVTIVTALEGTLGPGTMDLRLRIGIHSGSVTAGTLGGRFQIFGETVSLASCMESTSIRHRIQVSEATAELLKKANKADWIQEREERVANTKGTALKTYFVVITAPLSARAKSSYHQGQKSNMSLRSLRSAMSGGGLSVNSSIPASLVSDQTPKAPKRRQVWDDGEDNFVLSLPPMSRTAKNKRLVGWVTKLFQGQLRKLVAQRGNAASRNDFEINDAVLARVCHGDIPMDEVVNVLSPVPQDQTFSDHTTISSEAAEVKLASSVASQLRELVRNLANHYRDDNPFTNFEHASHTCMAVQKLLSRCITNDDDDEVECSSKSMGTKSTARQYMSSVAGDAMTQFALLFAALAHDCGHQGLSSNQLAKLNPELSEKYDHLSVAEQNSIDLAWETIMDPDFKDLQQCLFSSEGDLRRFRQVLVNTVLATDFSDAKAESMRNRRWDRAFHMSCDSSSLAEEDVDLKATVVIECLVEAADISHSMQHWKVYQKWNERFFREKSIAFDAGRSSCNPVQSWFQEELDFLDKYAIPLAKKLSESKVFGVASSECLNNVMANRKEWEEKGEQLVKDMSQRYEKRKALEIGGFTNEEINNFTPKELEYIMKKLVEKGRNKGSNQVDTKKGQNDAAQAWLDALEIYERSPAAHEISDRSIIFPIYSGLSVWIKGDKIPHDPDGYFELNLARKFVRESKLHLDPIHHTRALAMLSEVHGRQGNYKAALKEFEKLKEIYSVDQHSMAVAEVYGTDRAAHAFSFSALWQDQLGHHDEAKAACEYVIQDLLPLMDPKNTLGNFELLLPVMRVMKANGQSKRMRQLLQDYVIEPFQKYHGPNGFTPCMCLFKPLVWLLDICDDPVNFRDLDVAVEWLLVDDNGIPDEFLDCIYGKTCWAPHDMTAELCLRLANRLALEVGDIERQRILIEKGLKLAWGSEKKMTDMEGNVVLPIANEMHEPVFNAIFEVARQMGIRCDEADYPTVPTKMLDVNLPPSYLRAPDEGSVKTD